MHKPDFTPLVNTPVTRSPGSLAYGLLSILVLTPLLAMVALALPLEHMALSVGLAVYCCVPTSLSSNIAMTQVRVLSVPAALTYACLDAVAQTQVLVWHCKEL